MEAGVETYPRAAVERAMKVQEVILRAMAKKITWWQAAEIIGLSDRQMRRWRERYEARGYDGLIDRRRGRPSQKRVPMEQAERVLALYRERYFDLNVSHFHEKLGEQHGIELSYTWVKQALQGAGLVSRARRRGVHRRRRERRPVPGMLLHIDGSHHQWFQDERWYDLIVILDDATSEIYCAQLVREESTVTVMAAVREVIEGRGLFCALYSDRGSHFWFTPKGSNKVDPHRLTQLGRALRAGSADDSGLLAPGAGPLGTQLLDLAGTAAAGAAVARHHHGCGGQPLPARAVRGRVQQPLPGARSAAGHGLYRLPAARSGSDLLAAV